MLQFTQKDIDRFWSKVDKTSNPNGCWEWQISLTYNGYGRFKINGKIIRAHRFSYEIHYGRIPNGFNVLHHCDNPACVKPDHLFLGIHQTNMTDMVNKNRQAKGIKSGAYTHPEKILRGEQCYRTILTINQVIEIRNIYTYRFNSYSKLANKYNVTKSCIQNIIKRRSWKHI